MVAEAGISFEGDQQFESVFLQRGVWCEPDFRGRIPSMTVGDFANARGEFASRRQDPRRKERSVSIVLIVAGIILTLRARP